MDTVQGRISKIQRQLSDGGTRTTFRLHSTDGKETEVETKLDFPYTNGDVIEARGTFNSEGFLGAVEIVPKTVPRPAPPRQEKPFPWLWVIVGCGLLLLIVAGLAWLWPRGSTLTVTVTRCGKPLQGATLTLAGPKGNTCIVPANGICAFSGLPAGNYTIASGGATRPITVAAKSSPSVNFPIVTLCPGFKVPSPAPHVYQAVPKPLPR
jgi:hypothetical protein